MNPAVRCVDGVRLWVNGQLIISNWTAHALTENSNTIALAAGQFYDVTMEYFNLAGLGTAILSWLPPGESKQVIPATNLTPYQNNNPPVLAFIPGTNAVRNAQVSFTASAMDPDAPAQALSYSLDAGAPVGASIHPTSGVFTWTPSNTHPFGPCSFVVRVTDNGVPSLSDAQTVTLSVLTNATLSFGRAGNATVLSWPQSAGAAQLYCTTNLTPPVTWLVVTNVPVLSNGQWAVTLFAPANGAQFFRLQTP